MWFKRSTTCGFNFNHCCLWSKNRNELRPDHKCVCHMFLAFVEESIICRYFECDKHFCIVEVSHFGFMMYMRNLLLSAWTWCIIFIFPFSLTIHLYAKVDIEVYWLLRCVVRNIAWTYCLPIFKFNANSKTRVFSSNHCIKNITKDDLIFPHET